MYVCLCNGYRDTEIREIAESGVRCAREVYLTLGNGPCCGTCLDCAQDIVDSVHGGVGGGVEGGGAAAEDVAERAEEALLMAAE
ncbi:MAG TPA: (2Fe-2S)-binding protein [Kiloniellaceae bacterium]